MIFLQVCTGAAVAQMSYHGYPTSIHLADQCHVISETVNHSASFQVVDLYFTHGYGPGISFLKGKGPSSLVAILCLPLESCKVYVNILQWQ